MRNIHFLQECLIASLVLALNNALDFSNLGFLTGPYLHERRVGLVSRLKPGLLVHAARALHFDDKLDGHVCVEVLSRDRDVLLPRSDFFLSLEHEREARLLETLALCVGHLRSLKHASRSDRHPKLRLLVLRLLLEGVLEPEPKPGLKPHLNLLFQRVPQST